MVDKSYSEDTMILFTLGPRGNDLDNIIKDLDKYCRQKQKYDSTDRFNFCAFVENGPVYYEDFLFESECIIDSLKDLKPTLATPNLAGAIFVAITFIIDVFKTVGGKCFRLLILTDRGTPPLANVEVIQTLVSQVIEFPLYLDIVRIAVEDPREDLKLMRFAKANNGNVLFAKSQRELGKILDGLIEKKKFSKSSDEKELFISPENEAFFSNLSQDPYVTDDQKNVCSICRGKDPELVKCPKCGAIDHPKCLAMWAKMSNIGVPYLFRCMNCYNLLRLPPDFVADVQSGAYDKRIKMQAANQTDLLRERERNMTPHLKQGSDPLAGMSTPEPEPESGSDDGWGNKDTDFAFTQDNQLQIKFCEKCGTLNMPESIRCSKCGNRLK